MLTICLFTSLLLMSCLITFATVDFFFAGTTRYLHLSDIFFFKEKKKEIDFIPQLFQGINPIIEKPLQFAPIITSKPSKDLPP